MTKDIKVVKIKEDHYDIVITKPHEIWLGHNFARETDAQFVLNRIQEFADQQLSSFKRELLEKMPTKEMIEAESSEINLKDGRLYDSWKYAFDDEQQDAFNIGANWFRSRIIELLK